MSISMSILILGCLFSSRHAVGLKNLQHVTLKAIGKYRHDLIALRCFPSKLFSRLVIPISVLRFTLQYHENLGMSRHTWPHPNKSTNLNIFLTNVYIHFLNLNNILNSSGYVANQRTLSNLIGQDRFEVYLEKKNFIRHGACQGN